MSSATPSSDTAWRAGRFDHSAKPRALLFGRMYEDSAIELGAFREGGRIFCIASAGCTARVLSRAHEVVACDINPVQLAYAERRLHGAPVEVGSAERVMTFLRSLAPLAGWTRGVVQRFLALAEPEAQLDYWRRHLDTLRFRAGMTTLLSLTSLRAAYAAPLLDALPPSFPLVLRRRMERCFARHPNRENPYARLLFTGASEDAGTAPDSTRVSFIASDAASSLESCEPRSFDGFALSNITDGAGTDYRRRLSAAIRRAAKEEAIVVARSFGEPNVAIKDNRAAADRTMLWGVVEVCQVADWQP